MGNKLTIMRSLLAGFAAVVSGSVVQQKLATPCEPAIDVSQEQLDKEIDLFSRTFDQKHYDTAMLIYNEMRKHQGLNPHIRVHTWELYDKAFSFPRVRRYAFVQEWMDAIEHAQDNLNMNFTNHLHVKNFIDVCKNAEAKLLAKYQDGEFADPINFDPFADPPGGWNNVTL